MATAHSYIRFSTPEQRKGDSLRRQLAATTAWCERNNIPLSDLSYKDMGLSSFKGLNATIGELKRFKDLAADGTGLVKPGDYLILENLDRLSRQDTRPALTLFMSILDCGINIVQLYPETIFRHDKTDMLDIIRALIELSRGNSESEMKKERISKLWEEKRLQAIEHGKPMGESCIPMWIAIEGVVKAGKRIVDWGHFVLKPAMVALVRKIFSLTTEYGLGMQTIASMLNRESAIKQWSQSGIRNILRNRACIGEFKPVHVDKPILNYFPPILTEQEFFEAQKVIKSRTLPNRAPKGAGGRQGNNIANLFTSLVYDGRDKSVVACVALGKDMKGVERGCALHSVASRNGVPGTVKIAFPYWCFETAILAHLNDLVLFPACQKVDRAKELSTLLEILTEKIETIKALFIESPSKQLANVLATLGTEQAAMVKDLEDAKLEASAASPTANLESAQGLIAFLKTVEPSLLLETRLKLKATLRTLIERIWIVPFWLGAHRCLQIQINFKNGIVANKLIGIQQWLPVATVSGMQETDLLSPFVLMSQTARGGLHEPTPSLANYDGWWD